MENAQPCPQARSEQMLSTELPDGLLVYDLERDQGHFLNHTAALIWRSCDGQTSITELAQLLTERELPRDEEVIWLALQRLAKANLLCEPVPLLAAGISRRRAIRKLGLAGLAALLPAVVSLTAPTPAMAASGAGGVGGPGG